MEGKKNSIVVIIFSTALSMAYAQENNDSVPPKKIQIAAIPYFNYSRTVGLSLGLMATGFYKVNPKDTISPSSSTTAVGIYSTSKSYVAVVAQQFYLMEDTWRARALVGTGTGNLQFYEDFYSGGQFVDYSTKMRFAVLKVSRLVGHNLYFGVSGGIAKASTEFDVDLPVIDRRPEVTVPLNFLGLNFQKDSRDYVNYPSSGHNIQVDYKNFGEWLGNDSSFNKFEVTYDTYFNFDGPDKVLLARFYSNIALGDVPFVGQQTVGGDDIRGYSQGKYRDDELYSVQAEYRHMFKNRFGLVGFAGVATVVPEISEVFKETFLPGVGVGVRYRLLEKEKINIGVDVGFGKDDWSLTFRISDAFTR